MQPYAARKLNPGFIARMSGKSNVTLRAGCLKLLVILLHFAKEDFVTIQLKELV